MPFSSNQTVSYDGKLTFAVNLWMRSVLGDVFLGHNPCFAKIKERGNVMEGGLGPQIVEPLMIPQAGGPEVLGIEDPYADLEHVPMQGLTSAFYTPAEYAIPVSVSKRDMKLLTGNKVKRVQYVESVLKKALKQFFAKLNADFWAAEGATGAAGDASHLASVRCLLNRGGSSTTGTIEPLPLTHQIYNGGTAPGGSAVGSSPVTLVGGIERNAAEAGYWCTPIVTAGSDEVISVNVLNSMISLATRNDDVPDFGVIFRQGFDKLVTSLQGVGYANIFETSPVMKKFSAIRYRGVDLIFDDKVPLSVNGAADTGQLFILNTEYLKLVCDSMEPEMERKSDPKRLLMLWLGSWYGQLVSGHLGRVHSRHAALDLS